MNELITISPSGLAPLIKPAGYFNEKAKKIKNFMKWLEDKGGNFNAFGDMDTSALRNELLAINGVGPETADSILLYALSRKVFVVDAYTKRIFFRLGVFTGKEKYDEIQRRFHHEFRGEINEYNEYHALIVAHGKDICKKKPVCGMCCLSGMCRMLV
jgi:endonuclease-3 related protein